MAKRALEEGYAIGYFESWNLESLYGVVEAAEKARAEPGAVDATSEIQDEDYLVPLNAASVARPDRDVTLFAWFLMAHFARQAAERLAGDGIAAEVVDVRALAPLGWAPLETSARKQDGPSLLRRDR